MQIEEVIRDFRLAIACDAQLARDTTFFKGKQLLTQAMLDRVKYATLTEVFEIYGAIPTLKDALIQQYEAVQADALKRSREPTGWENVDMNNRSNW